MRSGLCVRGEGVAAGPGCAPGGEGAPCTLAGSRRSGQSAEHGVIWPDPAAGGGSACTVARLQEAGEVSGDLPPSVWLWLEKGGMNAVPALTASADQLKMAAPGLLLIR